MDIRTQSSLLRNSYDDVPSTRSTSAAVLRKDELFCQPYVYRINKRMTTQLENSRLELGGTSPFSDYIAYWVDDSHRVDFPNQSTARGVTGHDFEVDEGPNMGGVDGNGQLTGMAVTSLAILCLCMSSTTPPAPLFEVFESGSNGSVLCLLTRPAILSLIIPMSTLQARTSKLIQLISGLGIRVALIFTARTISLWQTGCMKEVLMRWLLRAIQPTSMSRISPSTAALELHLALSDSALIKWILWRTLQWIMLGHLLCFTLLLSCCLTNADLNQASFYLLSKGD